MEAGDGWLVRVKPRFGMLSAAQARFLADSATAFGNGMVQVTNRANLQLRGFRPADIPGFAAACVAHGLAHADPAVEARRNLLVSPLLGLDPAIAPATALVAAGIAEVLERDAALAGLAPKCGVVVDGGGVLPLGDVPADITVRLRGEACEVIAGRRIPCAPEEAVAMARDHLHGAARSGGRIPRLPPTEQATNPLGALPGAWGVAVPFGHLPAARLLALATAPLRLTPWRALLREGVAAGPAEDAPLGIDACVGRPACAAASVDTIADARALHRAGVLRGRSAHIAGCAKGCAQPRPRAITLVGRAGRYGLIRDGVAGAASVGAMTMAEVIALLAAEAGP